MQRAQNVAQAVVRTPSSLSSWLCIGPRRRPVGQSAHSKVDDMPEAFIVSESSETIITEVQTKDSVHTKLGHDSSSESGHDDTEEDEPLISNDRVMNSSTVEDVTEGELWYELEKELQRQVSEADIEAQAEEAAAAKEITEEEIVLANAAETTSPITSADVSDSNQFYPPGRIMHIVSFPSSSTADIDDDGGPNEHVGIYETPRELYSKIRLSRTMINDHYMPMYKKMMELLIRELENNEDFNCPMLQD